MLVTQVAAVRDSVVLVLRVIPSLGGAMQVLPAGTASYIGNDLFLTANHLFEGPTPVPGEQIKIASVPGNGSAMILPGEGVIEYGSAAVDIALLKVPGAGAGLKPLSISLASEPDGRSVFSYGFITPEFHFTPSGPVLIAAARACTSIIGSRSVIRAGRYELDAHTYPGESGAPVLRVADNVVVGIVQASRLVQVPAPPGPTAGGNIAVRGPTLAGELAPIGGEVAARGITPVG
jgi:hypothetical protein